MTEKDNWGCIIAYLPHEMGYYYKNDEKKRKEIFEFEIKPWLIQHCHFPQMFGERLKIENCKVIDEYEYNSYVF